MRATIAMGAERLGIVPIRFLRQHGYEGAVETVVYGRAMLARCRVFVGSASP